MDGVIYKPFADLLRSTRKKLKLTQIEVCKMVKVSQRNMSAWETGNQLPRFRRDLFDNLAKSLNIKTEIVVKAYNKQLIYKGTFPQGISSKEYLWDSQCFIEAIKPDNLELWFFNLQNLSVFEDRVFKESFIKNLKAGCNYNVVWFLDEVNNNTFIRYSKELVEISRTISECKSAGTITNYSLLLMDTSESHLNSSSTKRSYLNLSNSCFIKWLHVKDKKTKLYGIRSELLKYYSFGSSIILYLPKNDSLSSEAALNLNGFFTDIDNSYEVSPFYWFDIEHVKRIQNIANAIRI